MISSPWSSRLQLHLLPAAVELQGVGLHMGRNSIILLAMIASNKERLTAVTFVFMKVLGEGVILPSLDRFLEPEPTGSEPEGLLG